MAHSEKKSARERVRDVASTIFSHNAGVSCCENYDTVSSMKKKRKKKKKRKIKIERREKI